MTKHTTDAIYWDDEWLAIKVGHTPISNQWLFHAQFISNKEWYYGQADTIPLAIEAMEEKVTSLDSHGVGPHSVKKVKQNLEDMF